MTEQTKFTLYHYWRSSGSWRVRWAMAIKNVPCKFVPIDLLSGESESEAHLKRNPLGYVPVLEMSAGGGAPIYLAESVAIIEWLEETIPSPAFLPKNPLERAQIRQLCQIINSGTQPLQNLGVTEMARDDQEKRKEWNQHWIRHGFDAYETIASRTAGKFSFGDTITMADLFLIPQVYSAGRNHVSLDPYPTIKRVHENASLTDGFIASEPERFKPS